MLMENEEAGDRRVAIDAADVARLTLGCWRDMKPGRLVGAYCPACGNVDAWVVVAEFYLDVPHYCVTVVGKCQQCGDSQLVPFGVLDKQLRSEFFVETR